MMVHTGIEADTLRRLFLSSFVDKKSTRYREILRQVYNSNGSHYSGYLWDCLFRDHLKVVTTDFVYSFLVGRNSIYVFWDNHPESYFSKTSLAREYSKDSMLNISASQLEAIIEQLPEDFYIFDDSLSWAIAFTHEELSHGTRICYYLTI